MATELNWFVLGPCTAERSDLDVKIYCSFNKPNSKMTLNKVGEERKLRRSLNKSKRKAT